MKTKDGTEKTCGRCGDEGFRIGGFCSVECRDLFAVELERDEARGNARILAEHCMREAMAPHCIIAAVLAYPVRGSTVKL